MATKRTTTSSSSSQLRGKKTFPSPSSVSVSIRVRERVSVRERDLFSLLCQFALQVQSHFLCEGLWLTRACGHTHTHTHTHTTGARSAHLSPTRSATALPALPHSKSSTARPTCRMGADNRGVRCVNGIAQPQFVCAVAIHGRALSRGENAEEGGSWCATFVVDRARRPSMHACNVLPPPSLWHWRFCAGTAVRGCVPPRLSCRHTRGGRDGGRTRRRREKAGCMHAFRDLTLLLSLTSRQNCPPFSTETAPPPTPSVHEIHK